jgi:ribonuclease HIII
MIKLKTRKIPKDQVGNLVTELNNEPKIDFGSLSSDKEAFRGKIDGRLLLVYWTGTIVYHDHPLTVSILNKYPEVKSPPKKKSENDKPLNVKLHPFQCQILIKLLETNSVIKEIQSNDVNVLKTFEKEGRRLNIYHTGSVYSPNGYDAFNSTILEVIKQTPLYEKFDLVIGQDEAGKGEFFGPMVIASVALTGEQQIKLQLDGIKDSKLVSSNNIHTLANIVKNSSTAKRAITIGAKTFNQRFREMKNESKNLNDLLAWGHSKALSEVLSQLKQLNMDDKEILLIIDEFDRIKTDSRIQKVITPNITVEQQPKAESVSISVAAASILAKSIRNEEMVILQETIPSIPIKVENLSDLWYQPNADEIIRHEYVKSAKERGTLGIKQCIQGNEAQEHIALIIKRIESHNLDFKERFPQNASHIGKLLSAFANHEGGDLYFGIRNQPKEIIGISDVQALEERISGVREKCDPSPWVEYVIYELPDGKIILQAHVHKSKKLIASDGKYYYREKNSSRTRTLTTKEIEEMLKS